MVDPVTVNRGYAIPSHGTDVDSWDVPLNGDFNLIDQNLGAVSNIALSNINVVLSPSQYACGTIRLSGALTTDVSVTFPAVSGWWVVDNQTTGASAVQLICSLGGNRIGLPQGVASDVFTDGANIGFRNLPGVGTYWDFAGSSIPRWVAFCTIAPWLNCDGSSFSAVTYPYLFALLGSTSLPDFRGRSSFYLNAGTGRLTSAGAGIDGDVHLGVGGLNGITLAVNQIPAGVISQNLTQPITVSNAANYLLKALSGAIFDFPSTGGSGLRAPGSTASMDPAFQMNGNNAITVTSVNGAQQGITNAAPGIVSGIRMIRAA